MEILDRHFLDNPVLTWLIAIALAIAVWAILPFVKSRCSMLARRADRQHAGLDLALRLVEGTTQVFAWAVALYVAERLLNLPREVERASTVVVLVLGWVQAGLWALIVFDYFMERRTRRGSGDTALAGSVAVIRFMALVTIWSLVLLLVLDNLGVDVTALIAGLGIGGVAVALAVQALLKDLLGSLSIALDRPFILGDTVTIGQLSGKVEHIGVKSTRLRSTSGEQIVLSNAELVQARIRNFGRMDERRGVMVFSVAYETPSGLVKRVSAIAKDVIDAQPGVRFDRCHFRSFGADGLIFEAVFFVIDAQLDALLNVQQIIHLALKDALGRAGIPFAYPVQRVELQAVAALTRLS